MISDSLFEKLLNMPNGARFYRVDLHNHTPCDRDFCCGEYQINTKEEIQAFALAYVRFAREQQSLDVIGVTEHNDVGWLPYIQAAADEIGLTVFPGVELGAESGKRQVHFLALFEPGTTAETIDDFITTLGLMREDRFQPDGVPKVVQKNTRELTDHICRAGGKFKAIAVAAHVSGKNGLFHELEGETRVLAYLDKNLMAVEIPETRESLSAFERALVDGEAGHYGQKTVACLNHSDGRGLDQVQEGRQPIGSKATRIKMTEPSVEGLRQAFIDFDSRVRLEGEYQEEQYPRLLGIAVEGGFLAGDSDGSDPFILRFNPNLNTVIGGRGTGKSALIEAIRHVFDLPPRTEESRKQSEMILGWTLPPGARVTAFYELADGTRYRISRLKNGDPEVYDLETEEKKGVHPSQILPDGLPIEVYSQKEIFEISKDPSFQLNLLDTYIAEPLQEIKRQETDVVRWLESNARDILSLQEEITQAAQRQRELEGVRLQLEQMERHEAVSRLERKKQAEREKTLLDQTENAVTDRMRALELFREEQTPLDDTLPDDLEQENLPQAAMLLFHAKLLNKMDEIFNATLLDLEKQLKELWSEGETTRKTWSNEYQVIQSEYEALQRELGEDFSADRYFALRAKLQMLEGIAREVQRRQQRLSELSAERREKLEALQGLRRTQEFTLREEKAAQLTQALQDTVRVTVELEGDREAYADWLTELFAGRRITKGVICDLAYARTPAQGSESEGEYTTPIHLAEAIRLEQENPAEEQSVLATVYGVSEAYRKRLCSVDDEILYQLEIYRVPDLPDVCLKVGDRYRSLNPSKGEAGLSTGQKCTAILSIILVERDAPLVIDQPEDDLDNEFIFSEIVQTLRREKERRQFIIATHNANIPVSGDAELIVVMQADENHGWIEHLGSIDTPEIKEPVENVLEGGREAFRIRQEKYTLVE